MIRFVLLLLAIALLCAWLAPDNRFGESCARDLESHAFAMNFGHGALDDDPPAQSELDRRPPRQVVRRAATGAAMTAAHKRKRVTPFISKKPLAIAFT